MARPRVSHKLVSFVAGCPDLVNLCGQSIKGSQHKAAWCGRGEGAILVSPSRVTKVSFGGFSHVVVSRCFAFLSLVLIQHLRGGASAVWWFQLFNAFSDAVIDGVQSSVFHFSFPQPFRLVTSTTEKWRKTMVHRMDTQPIWVHFPAGQDSNVRPMYSSQHHRSRPSLLLHDAKSQLLEQTCWAACGHSLYLVGRPHRRATLSGELLQPIWSVQVFALGP